MTSEMERILQRKKRKAARAQGEHALDSAVAEVHGDDVARTVEREKRALQNKAKAADELKRM